MNPDAAIAPHCEQCDYELTGLTSNVCPECGRVFDPLRLRVSRIPWTRRRTIGWVRAYALTLREVTLRPQTFAREATTGDDQAFAVAHSFRMATVCVASALIGLLLAVGFGISANRVEKIPVLLLSVAPLGAMFTAACMFGTTACAREVRVRRDLGGTPARATPIMYYACAPLVVSPLVGVIGCFALPGLLSQTFATLGRRDLPANLAILGASAVMLACWINVIRLTRLAVPGSTRCLVQAIVVVPFGWAIVGCAWGFFMFVVIALADFITG